MRYTNLLTHSLTHSLNIPCILRNRAIRHKFAGLWNVCSSWRAHPRFQIRVCCADLFLRDRISRGSITITNRQHDICIYGWSVIELAMSQKSPGSSGEQKPLAVSLPAKDAACENLNRKWKSAVNGRHLEFCCGAISRPGSIYQPHVWFGGKCIIIWPWPPSTFVNFIATKQQPFVSSGWVGKKERWNFHFFAHVLPPLKFSGRIGQRWDHAYRRSVLQIPTADVLLTGPLGQFGDRELR